MYILRTCLLKKRVGLFREEKEVEVTQRRVRGQNEYLTLSLQEKRITLSRILYLGGFRDSNLSDERYKTYSLNVSAPHMNCNENWECWKDKLKILKPRKWNDLKSKTCRKNSSEVLLHAFQIQCRGILTIQTWLYGCNHQSTISMKCSSPETCLFVTNSPRQASPQSLPQCCLPSCAPSTSRSLNMRQFLISRINNILTLKQKQISQSQRPHLPESVTSRSPSKTAGTSFS